MKCLNPLRLKMKRKIYEVDDSYEEHEGFVDVPCGKCMACLSNRKRDWVFRLMQEHRHCLSSHFITLTYDDEHLVRNGYNIPVLVPDDLQKFMKRYRKYFHNDKNIRFFAVGEYGSETLRPHYHIVMFNTPVCDIHSVVCCLWRSGFADIGQVNDQSINYICKYCLAGSAIPEIIQDFKDYEVPLPFMRCSRRPAIGSCYLTDDNISYHYERQSLMTVLNGSHTPLPRYYRDKIFSKYQVQVLGEEAQANALVDKQFDKWAKCYGTESAYRQIYDQQLQLFEKMRQSFKLNRTL